MRFLWNHEKISYERSVEMGDPDGTPRAATPVKYDGEVVGYVTRAEIASDGWGYRLFGEDAGPWIVGFETRADAADNLLSYRSPSAGWLA